MKINKDTIVLAALEFNSIAIGITALDQMVKTAPISIIDAKTMCPGKYIIVFSGDVASVEYSFIKGTEIGGKYIVDSLYLPMIHQDVIPAIGNVVETESWETIGIIETNSVISSIQSADIAVKEGGVKIIEIRIAIGFGGKSYVKLMGDLNSVEAAMEAGTFSAKEKNQLHADAIIIQPHSEIKSFFMKGD